MAFKVIVLIIFAAFISVITAGSYLELFIIDIDNTMIFTVSLLILIWLIRSIITMLRPGYNNQIRELRALRKERKRLEDLTKKNERQQKELEESISDFSSRSTSSYVSSSSNYNYSSNNSSSYSKPKESSGSSMGCLVGVLAVIFFPFTVIYKLMKQYM